MTYRIRIGTHVWRSGHPKKGSAGKFTCDLNDEEFMLGSPSGCHCIQTCKRTRLRGPLARAGLLYVVLLMSLGFIAVVGPKSHHDLHDLSHQLLLAGDVERNPGPMFGADSFDERNIPKDIVSLSAMWEQRFSSLEMELKRKNNDLQAELEKQIKTNHEMANTFEREFDRMKRKHEHIFKEIVTLNGQTNTLAADMKNIERMCENATDKNESIQRRNNVKMFGVIEQENETYWSCLQAVLNALREALPKLEWNEKDIVRVQRLGPSNRKFPLKPRPILVEMATLLDKLTLLRAGRNNLRKMGIRIAGDLTSRQSKTIFDLKQQGHQAYFKNGKLCFHDVQILGKKSGQNLGGMLGSGRGGWHIPVLDERQTARHTSTGVPQQRSPSSLRHSLPNLGADSLTVPQPFPISRADPSVDYLSARSLHTIGSSKSPAEKSPSMKPSAFEDRIEYQLVNSDNESPLRNVQSRSDGSNCDWRRIKFTKKNKQTGTKRKTNQNHKQQSRVQSNHKSIHEGLVHANRNAHATDNSVFRFSGENDGVNDASSYQVDNRDVGKQPIRDNVGFPVHSGFEVGQDTVSESSDDEFVDAYPGDAGCIADRQDTGMSVSAQPVGNGDDVDGAEGVGSPQLRDDMVHDDVDNFEDTFSEITHDDVGTVLSGVSEGDGACDMSEDTDDELAEYYRGRENVWFGRLRRSSTAGARTHEILAGRRAHAI